MKFNNTENKCHLVDGKEVWESRSVAVVGMILMLHEGEKYVLLGKRGEGVPNEVGKWCMPCGFLDFDETCEEAVVREIWEESGFNVTKAIKENEVIHNHMHYPWRIHSVPESNQQNVSLHYAVYFKTKSSMYKSMDRLPEVTTIHNAEKDEVSEVKWVKVDKIKEYEMAFNHDGVIRVFVNNLPNE